MKSSVGLYKKKSKFLSLMLSIVMLMSSLTFNTTVFADTDEWLKAASTPSTPYALTNGAQIIGTFCFAKDIEGIEGIYVKSDNESDGSFGSQLNLSANALAEIRYVVAEMQSNFKGSTFNQDLAGISFPSETLARKVGKLLTQDFIWYRQYLDNPSAYPEPDNFSPMTNEEKNYFYRDSLNLTDTLGVNVSTATATETNGYWGPYKISYAPGSSANLKEINNYGINKDILPTFSVEGDGVAYLYNGNTLSSTKLGAVPMDTEFYIWPIKSGTNTIRIIPNSTIITGIESESIFESPGFQPQYGLVFSTYEDAFEVEVTRTAPEDDYRIDKGVTRFSGSPVGDYGYDISVSPGSEVLYRVDAVVENVVGIDIVLPAELPTTGPIKVYTAEQLANVSNDLTESYILMNNIDLDKYLTVNDWEPIGNTATPFTGTFDGNGYTIANLIVKSDEDIPLGLFGVAENATIKNLAMSKVTITGKNYLGAIVGLSEGSASVIDNCIVGGTARSNITGNAPFAGGAIGSGYVGGIAGKAEGTLSNLTVDNAIIRAHYYVGGIFGAVGEATVTGCEANNTWFMQTVSGAYPIGLGGITGAVVPSTQATVIIEDCVVTNFRSMGSSMFGIGGIVGQADINSDASNSGSRLLINNCSFIGGPSTALNRGIRGSSFVGGILGGNTFIAGKHNVAVWSGAYFDAEISNCTVEGETEIVVMTSSPSAMMPVGGIAGTATKISNCYAKAEIQASNPMVAGGIVGVANGDVTDCFSEGTIERTFYLWPASTLSTGGIVGVQDAAAEINRCISTMDIINSASSTFTAVMDKYHGIGYSSASGSSIKNSIAANTTIQGVSNQQAYKVGEADTLSGNLSYDVMVATPIFSTDDGETTVNGLATTWTDLTTTSTYTDRGYDFYNVWNEPEYGNLPTLRNLGPVGVVGANFDITLETDGIWAKAIMTAYITDDFNLSPLSTKDLLDKDLNPYDTNSEGVMLHVSPGEKLTFYYLADAIYSGVHTNEVAIFNNVLPANIPTLNIAKASAIARVDSAVENKNFYVDVNKFGDDIRNQLSGSNFTLYRYESSEGYTGAMTQIAVITPENNTPVKILTSGYYMLKETVNPEGFIMDDIEYRFLFNGNKFIPEALSTEARGSFAFETVGNNSTMILENVNVSESKPSNPGSGSKPKPKEVPLLDLENHYVYIIGYPDGTVRPNNHITRAETASVFFRLLTQMSRETMWSKTNSYPDVNTGDWFMNAVSTLDNGTILLGYPDGTFKPNGKITRAEFASIAVRFDTSATGEVSSPFTDISGHWAEENIKKAYELGYISGYPDGTFKPDAPITRAEVASLMNNVLNRHVNSQEDMLDGIITFPDNTADAWYYYAVQEAINSHDYERKADGKNEKWSVLISPPDWVLLNRPEARVTDVVV